MHEGDGLERGFVHDARDSLQREEDRSRDRRGRDPSSLRQMGESVFLYDGSTRASPGFTRLKLK